MKQHIENEPEIKILKLIRNVSDELLEVEKEKFRDLQSGINHFEKALAKKTLPQNKIDEVNEEISNLKKRLIGVKYDRNTYHEASKLLSSYLKYKNDEYYSCEEFNLVETFENQGGEYLVKDVTQLHAMIPMYAKSHIAHEIFKFIKMVYVESREIDEKVLDERIKAHQIDFDIKIIDLPAEYQINRKAFKWLFPNGYISNALPESWSDLKQEDKYIHIMKWAFENHPGTKEDFKSIEKGKSAQINFEGEVLSQTDFLDRIFVRFRQAYPDCGFGDGSFDAFKDSVVRTQVKLKYLT